MITLQEFNREINIRGHNRLRTSKRGTKSYVVKDHIRKLKDKDLSLIRNVALGGAATLATALLIPKATKSIYRSRFKKTAESIYKDSFDIEDAIRGVKKLDDTHPLAKQIKEINSFINKEQVVYPDKIKRQFFDPDKPNITLTIGGFDGVGTQSKAMIQGMPGFGTYKGARSTVPDILDEDSLLPFINDKFQPDFIKKVEKIPGIAGGLQALKQTGQTIKYMGDVAIKKGRNEDAVNLAKLTVALERAYPDKNIRYLASSGGGMVSSEAAEYMNILKSQGKSKADLKVANIGSPYWGMTNLSDKQAKTIISSKDYDMFKATRQQNRVVINDVLGHGIFKNTTSFESGYFESPSFKKELRKHFYNKD